MGNPLFDRRTPQEWAKVSQPIVFDEKITGFERLFQSLAENDQNPDAQESAEDVANRRVCGELTFGKSAFGQDVAALDGQAVVTVTLTCQRCLKPMDWRLEADLSLLLAAEGQASAIEQNVWELDTDFIAPVEIVDEALVMALPLVARHDDESCSAAFDSNDSAGKETIRPFADLRTQMEDKT